MKDSYELGPFRLDTHNGMLLRGSEPVALGRRAVAVLRALVERPGALVSKDELIEAAWPGQAVEESNLTVQIAALRRELGKAPGADRWIETMKRRGYRFVGPVGAKEENSVTAAPPRVDAPRAAEPIRHEEAGRRQITAMSCEAVGAAARADGIGLEDLPEAIGAFQHCVSEIVGRHSGFIASSLGNTVLVLFGYPAAHEHDAERAIHAGLELCAAVRNVTPDADVPMQCRVGIATGMVIVGDLTGIGEVPDHGIVGDTPDLALRLQVTAQPDTVTIEPTTWRLIGSLFDCRDLGALDANCDTKPIRRWQVLGESVVASRFETLRGSKLTPLVGRDEEIDLLRLRWARAPPRVERRLAAIMAADVVGYSRLMGADEAGTLTQLKAHRRELVDPKIEEHRGRIVKATGDGMLVEFVSSVESVRCAVEIQRGMVTRNSDVPQHKRITFRMGINLGDVIAEQGELFGDGVNLAALNEALCEPGGIAISRAVREQIRDKLPFAFTDIGEHEVKNIARPVRVYALTAAAIEALPEAHLSGSPKKLRLRNLARSPFILGSARAIIVIPLIAGSVLASMLVLGGVFLWHRSPDNSPSATVISATADKSASPGPLITAVAPSAALAKLAAAPAPRMSIVVLPFTNLSGDPSQDYFADGFTDNLTTDLSRIPGSFVIASPTASTYKGKALSGRQIASELGVGYILDGSVQKAGNQLRVNARLINGETSAQLWAERYDRDSADMLRMQDEITNQIANALNLTLTQSEADRSWRDHPTNPDSFDLTLRAMALLIGPRSPEIYTKARRLYEQAVELDPENADALVGLAGTYNAALSDGWPLGIPRSEALKRIDSALATALAINPRSASAYVAKSEAFAFDDRREWRGELAPAIEAAEVALTLDPNGPKIFGWLGRLYAKAGHPERTSALVAQAIRLSPRDPNVATWLWVLGMSQLQMGDNDNAIETFQKSLVLAPQGKLSWAGLAGAFIAAGRDGEAYDAVVKWHEIAVNEGAIQYRGEAPEKEILQLRVQLALLRLGRWPYQLGWRRHLSIGLISFQANENLPQTGQPDEVTLARLGITSQASASTSK